MLPIFTTQQVENGFGTADLMIDLSDYMKKKDVEDFVSQEKFNDLTEIVANKLDATPQHSHHIDDIKQLQSLLNDKYDKGEKYPFNVILSNPEKISYLEAPKINNLEIINNSDNDSNYKFYVDESNGDLIISVNNVAIATYSKASQNWIFAGFSTGSLVDGEMLLNNITTNAENISSVDTKITEYITKTDAVLKNHYDAILAICEKLDMVEK